MARVVQRSTVVTLFTIVVLSLLASSLLQRYLGHVLDTPDNDFMVYFVEAKMVHDAPHAPMYLTALQGNPQLRWAPADSDIARRAQAAGLNGIQLYLYPPALADLLVPAVRLPPQRAAALWRVVNLAVVLLCVALLTRAAGLRIRSLQAGLLLFCTYAFWPVHEAVAQGQITIILFGLWTLGTVAYARRWVGVSALAFALATWFKVSPVLLVGVLLIFQDWKWLRDYLVACTAIGAFILRYNGWANLKTSFTVLQNMGAGVPATANKCISALLWWIRLGYPATPSQARVLIQQPQPVLFLLLCKVLSAGFLVYCLLLVYQRRNRYTPADRAIVLAAFALVVSVVSPVSWRHGYVIAIPLLALLWMRALASPAVSVVRAAALTLTTVTMGSLCFDLGSQAHLPAPLPLLLASTWVVFCLVLCVDTLRNEPSIPTLVPQLTT